MHCEGLTILISIFFSLYTDALKKDIDTDKQVAIKSLERSPYARYASDAFFQAHNKL